ncbi:MAG: fumarylacetoacetase [Rhodospirillaceae bacterium]
MPTLNDTHDPARRSWVESANRPDADFPIQNLPLGVFRQSGGGARGGIAIGDMILDLAAAVAAGLFKGDAEAAARAAAGPALNPLMALGNGAASALRAAVSDLLRDRAPGRDKVERCLVPLAAAAMEMPAAIGNFTDFMCAIDHTRRMSPEGVPPACFTSLPIAYHSRATTVRISGTPLVRPNGQYRGPDGKIAFGPEPSQDFELEFGVFVGRGNEMGRPIPMAAAPDSLFGFCLVNDWSARGIQVWEGRPLGPFLGKSMMTSISPWVVTAEALRPFRAPAHPRPAGEAPLPHLSDAVDEAEGGIDIVLTAEWSTEAMRHAGTAPAVVTRTNFRDCYWTFAQMLTHHASNGCSLQPGDLLASGTVSGPTDGSRACIAELTKRGTEPLSIGGEPRAWLADGDEVTFRGRASRDGHVAIGFGECRGRVTPAVPWPAG